MANIYLIRHGQASWGKSDYDQLSDLGHEQGKVLGAYWQKLLANDLGSIDLCYSGSLLRHGQTAQGFCLGLEQNLPVTSHSGFNEFDHQDVLKCYKQEWHDQVAFVNYLRQQDNPNQAFFNEFKKALQRWYNGEHLDYKESFADFKSRCNKALADVITQANMSLSVQQAKSNKDILIFTSGGVISAICSELQGLDNRNMMKLNQQIVNTSVTKLLFNQDRVTVDSINNYSHLELAGKSFVTRK